MAKHSCSAICVLTCACLSSIISCIFPLLHGNNVAVTEMNLHGFSDVSEEPAHIFINVSRSRLVSACSFPQELELHREISVRTDSDWLFSRDVLDSCHQTTFHSCNWTHQEIWDGRDHDFSLLLSLALNSLQSTIFGCWISLGFMITYYW